MLLTPIQEDVVISSQKGRSLVFLSFLNSITIHCFYCHCLIIIISIFVNCTFLLFTNYFYFCKKKKKKKKKCSHNIMRQKNHIIYYTTELIGSFKAIKKESKNVSFLLQLYSSSYSLFLLLLLSSFSSFFFSE